MREKEENILHSQFSKKSMNDRISDTIIERKFNVWRNRKKGKENPMIGQEEDEEEHHHQQQQWRRR